MVGGEGWGGWGGGVRGWLVVRVVGWRCEAGGEGWGGGVR